MKKYINTLSAFALLFSLTTPVLAQTNIPVPSIVNKREEFQRKLLTIRNEKKKAIVERIDRRIVQINSTRTSIMLRHLTTIEEILNRIEVRALEAEKNGKDITKVKAAIQKARDAIVAARNTVSAQATKTYTIKITTEANLGSAVSATRTAFAKDLLVAQKSVVTARKAAHDVLTVLADVVGEKLTNTIEK